MSSNVELDLRVLNAFAGNAEQALSEGLLAAGEHIEDLASQLAPEDTGDLKNSGMTEQVERFTVEVSFGNNLDDNRAIAQEYGTVFAPAQPYLSPAAKEIDIVKEVADRIKL